jgi:hypothetical protein
MEMHYQKSGQGSETVYVINPRILQEGLEKKIKNEKLTTINVCRSILATLQGSNLKEDEDYFVTTTTHGRKQYHVKANSRTIDSMSRFL